MEVNYQQTAQLNTEILSYRQHFAAISFFLPPSKKLVSFLIKIIRRALFKKLDGLSNFFKENRDIFPNEYYDCLEINDMIKYTLNRNISLIKPEDLKFISDMSDSFFDMISAKLEMILDNDCVIDEKLYDAFNPKYVLFNEDLLKSKEYFYENIYNESFDEQEVADYLQFLWE